MFVIRKFVLDIIINVAQLEFPFFAVLNTHGNHGYITVGRFGIDV